MASSEGVTSDAAEIASSRPTPPPVIVQPTPARSVVPIRFKQRATVPFTSLPILITAITGVVTTLAAWLIWGRQSSGAGPPARPKVRGSEVVSLGKTCDAAASLAGSTTSRSDAGGKVGHAKGQADSRGTNSRCKPNSKCVPLADGSACVVRREIPADNSCLFNAVGYCMHHSKTRASFLRSVVAREVSSDPESYTPVFLGMHNAEYCRWIENRMNWGGAIELAILVKHYNREIGAWNIETAKCHTFGEEAGFPKQVMVIYTGSHYDALAIAASPKAPQEDDITEFNPRTKRGKMILAAAQKLVELTHRGSKFYSPRMKCTTCSVVFKSQQDAGKHAQQTGHQNFEQTK